MDYTVNHSPVVKDDDNSSCASLEDSIFSVSDAGTEITCDLRKIHFRIQYPRILPLTQPRLLEFDSFFRVPFYDDEVADVAEEPIGPFFQHTLGVTGWLAIAYISPATSQWEQKAVLHPNTGYSSFHQVPGQLAEEVASWSPLYVDVHLQFRIPKFYELLQLSDALWIVWFREHEWANYFHEMKLELSSILQEAEAIASVVSSCVWLTVGVRLLRLADVEMGRWYRFGCMEVGEVAAQKCLIGLLLLSSITGKIGKLLSS
ncbi:uncharacterized protein DFL_009868 [Arthrobotrys flagrans]|uniref:Uncharacterized protein n=1 Tax=Arthrobotrys flagrans TaxID=97331 RepID=A0A436ZSU7_ARTFL|nr:hypothetical protein DFL_009868 [Arthrobotrys flagrans]